MTVALQPYIGLYSLYESAVLPGFSRKRHQRWVKAVKGQPDCDADFLLRTSRHCQVPSEPRATWLETYMTPSRTHGTPRSAPRSAAFRIPGTTPADEKR